MTSPVLALGLTALVALIGWMHARKGWRVARAGWELALKQAADAQQLASLQRIELDHVRTERARLTIALATEKRERELERGNVRKLVPSFSSAKASDSNAGFLRQAFRAWILWFNDCPVVLPFSTLVGSHELDDGARLLMCCELYSRAIMESAFAEHLDGENPRSDRHVLTQLAQSLGDAFAERVAADVALRGVTFSLAAPPAARPVTEASALESALPTRAT